MELNGLTMLKARAKVSIETLSTAGGPNSRKRNKPFRNPLAIKILREIAEDLRREGYEIGQVRTGKACDAVFYLKLKDISYVTMLSAELDPFPNVLECYLEVRPRRSLLHIFRPPRAVTADMREELKQFLPRDYEKARSTCRPGITGLAHEIRFSGLVPALMTPCHIDPAWRVAQPSSG